MLCGKRDRRISRVYFYLRLAGDDPPEHPARPPCELCTLTKRWSTAPPYIARPAPAGEARAGRRLVRRFASEGGDGS